MIVMKAAAFFSCGGPENIGLAEVPKPTFGESQALIRVEACALNHMDLWMLAGPPDPGFQFPFWGGADIAGVVAAVGRRVTAFRPGDRVLVNPNLYCDTCEHCLAGEQSLCISYGILGGDTPGGLAEYVAVAAKSLMRLPDDLAFIEAAAVPLVFQTAWRALISQGSLRPGEDIVILGASGGVATAAIQIAKLAGARVFAVTSSPEKAAKATLLGADFALNRTQDDYWAEIRRLTGDRGVDLVLDSVGGPTWPESLKSLVNGGRLVTYGRTAGGNGDTDIGLVFWNQLRIIGSTMSSNKEFAEVVSLVFQRRLRPVIDRVFPLEETAAAYRHLRSGQQFGKVVVQVA